MFDKLKQWREERHISGYVHETQVSNIVEEVFELLTPVDEQVKQNTKEFMYKYYINLTNDNQKIDALCDIIVFCTNAIELLGYDAEKCMDETIKEISSRLQDPIQKEIWSKWGFDNTKWEKDKNQPKDTLYVADYAGCKR